MSSDRKTAVVVWASVAAAAAGVAVVAAAYKWNMMKTAETESVHTDHRHLAQVLSDCYEKIQEIQDQLPAVDASVGSSTRTISNLRRRAVNGKAIVES